MRILFDMDKHDYQDNEPLFIRHSARTIIIESGLVALVYSKKYDYYKFPGGGIEENETPVAAAIRETKEEAGIIVNERDLIPYGLVKRKEKSNIQGVFVQDNYYYLVNNYKLSYEQKLDDYEKDEGYTLSFVEPLHAITVNRTHSHGDTNQNMLERDAKVLELLIDEGYLK